MIEFEEENIEEGSIVTEARFDEEPRKMPRSKKCGNRGGQVVDGVKEE